MKQIALGFTLAIAVSACASLPAKQQSVVSLQASEMALRAAQKTERALCAPNADQAQAIAHCDGQNAAAIGLTDARHIQLAGIFSKAFQAQISAATVLQTWKAGDPAPASLAEYTGIINQLLALVTTLDDQIRGQVTDAQSAAAKAAAAVGGN